MSKTTRRILLALLAILVVLGLLALGWYRSLSYPLPEMAPSAEADALARAMMESVNHEAWLRTGAVEWVFAGQHVHKWDRERGLALVAWEVREEGEPRLIEVFFDLDSRQGIVFQDRVEITSASQSEQRSEWLRQAWEYWVNDSFWLNPVAKLFDEGTTRGLISPQQGEFDEDLRGLLVSYGSGGVTPGDSYLWLVDSNDRPVAWRMWTKILPIQGVETSWEGWQELATGAVVATRHQTPIGALGLSEVRGTARLTELLEGRGPFLKDFERLAELVGKSEQTPDGAESEAVAADSP
ncbi:MAG: hypothetical protein MPN21_20545 [Thermoanaerobaculia bacterium]|nr:hypothetical protein [Thermoanaerobaculia bacterium]